MTFLGSFTLFQLVVGVDSPFLTGKFLPCGQNKFFVIDKTQCTCQICLGYARVTIQMALESKEKRFSQKRFYIRGDFNA